jgi:YVTN family beta-propeller protein
MKNTKLSFLTLTALGLFAAAVPALAADYKFIKEIPVGGAGRFDYLIVDPAAHRLYVSHGTSAVVIDIDTDKLVGEVTNTPGIHGIAFLPELGIGFTSNGRENKVSVFDLKTLATKTKIDTGANPDAILFEPGQNEVYTFNGRSNSSSVIDPKALKVVATIPLSGKPETAVADPKAGRVYDNIENKSEVAVIDTKSHSVVATWPIAPGEEPSGMAADLEHHRIFIGCGGNNVMEMMDTTSGKVVGSVPIDGGVDANAFDPGTQLAFASCGSGYVTIAHEDSPDKLTTVQRLTTQNGARTIALDTKTHKIYLSVGQDTGFKVLVYGM